jgi:hypothetical protein
MPCTTGEVAMEVCIELQKELIDVLAAFNRDKTIWDSPVVVGTSCHHNIVSKLADTMASIYSSRAAI